MSQIVNGASMVIDQGIDDQSKRRVPRAPESIPQHLPKWWTFAQKGNSDENLVVGSELINIYGEETFNMNGRYATYSTPFILGCNAEGNSAMIKRLIPEDASYANAVLYMDVLPTKVDDYQRNYDGSIKLDVLGQPIIIGQIQGYKVKFVLMNRTGSSVKTDFGQAGIVPGDQVDSVTGTQSTRYPIMELLSTAEGEYYNTCGFRLWAPTIKNVQAMPNKMMAAHRAYPYFLAMIRKPDAQTAPKIVPSIMGEQRIMVTFKQDVTDPLTSKRLYIDENMIQAYESLSDPRYPKQYGDFSQLVVHQNHIEHLLELFHAAEVPFIDGFSDFSASPKEKHMFNFVTGQSSQAVPYHSFVFIDSPDTVRFTEFTNVYASGGEDGTMDMDTYARLVANDARRYLDLNDELMELAYHVESIVYDTGFPMDTKKALFSVIANRKDTVVVPAVFEAGDRELEPSEEHSKAIALRTRAEMFPESDYFGTEVCRAMIIGRSGKIRNSEYKQPLPLTYEVMRKAAKYMGAGNGRWKNGQHFDGAPGSILDYMTDINITWVPTAVRNRNWDVGLNWVQRYDRKSFFFPALKTVYTDDTSVLNSFPTVMACAQLNKVAHAVWREFSGVSNLTEAQLIDRVNAEVVRRTQDRFDSRFVIEPDAFFTDMDVLRGFSWTLPIKIYANTMRTVMTTYVTAYRMSDLEQQ